MTHTLAIIAFSSQIGLGAVTWLPNTIAAKRTDGTAGGIFDGARPQLTDADSNGIPDDANTVLLTTGIDVDTEASGLAAGINLAGDFFDWSMSFRIYDADGVFSFTENFDDSVRINALPITSNVDGSARGAAGPTFQDLVWNARTYANYDFSATAGGGWFDISIELDEVGGGAQSAGGIGIGYFNGASTLESDFGGIGYAPGAGQASIDIDGNGNSFGVAVPEPSSAILSLLAFGMLGYRRR